MLGGGGRIQASGRSVFVYCLGVDLQTLRLSADFSAALGFFFLMIHLHLITDKVVVLLLSNIIRGSSFIVEVTFSRQ